MSANKQLQAKLREMIDQVGLTPVSRSLRIGRETIARYLADLHMHESTLGWIESGVVAADRGEPRRVVPNGKVSGAGKGAR